MSESNPKKSSPHRQHAATRDVTPENIQSSLISRAAPSHPHEALTGWRQISQAAQSLSSDAKATPKDLDIVASDATHHAPVAPYPWKVRQLPKVILTDGSSLPTSGVLHVRELANFPNASQLSSARSSPNSYRRPMVVFDDVVSRGVSAGYVTKEHIENAMRQAYVSRAPLPTTSVQLGPKTPSVSDGQVEGMKRWCEWPANARSIHKVCAGTPLLLKVYIEKCIQEVLASNAWNRDASKKHPPLDKAERACVRKHRRR